MLERVHYYSIASATKKWSISLLYFLWPSCRCKHICERNSTIIGLEIVNFLVNQKPFYLGFLEYIVKFPGKPKLFFLSTIFFFIFFIFFFYSFTLFQLMFWLFQNNFVQVKYLQTILALKPKLGNSKFLGKPKTFCLWFWNCKIFLETKTFFPLNHYFFLPFF